MTKSSSRFRRRHGTLRPFGASVWTAPCSGRQRIWRRSSSISNATITSIGHMRGWTGGHRNRARIPAASARVSVRIDGSRTVVGCIKRRRRRDACATEAPGVTPETRNVPTLQCHHVLSASVNLTLAQVRAKSQEREFVQGYCSRTIENSPATGTRQLLTTKNWAYRAVARVYDAAAAGWSRRQLLRKRTVTLAKGA